MIPIRDNIPSAKLPVVTWGLILINVGIFVYQVFLPEDALDQLILVYGVVPRRFTNPFWAVEAGFPGFAILAFLTSMFLHGGLLHLLSNMWTLWIFGDNVEDRMGHFWFLLFYIVCGVASGMVHTVTNFGSMIPAIGASGAIAGVLAAYFVLFPLARITCVFPIIIYPLIFQVHAFVFGIFWFWMQFMSGTLSLLSPGHGGGIAWWAHIGGFVVGLLVLKRFLPAKSSQPVVYTHNLTSRAAMPVSRYPAYKRQIR